MKTYEYERDLIKRQMETEQKAIAAHIEALDSIVDVLKQFDGKVVTVRLQKAIKEQTGRYFGYDRFTLTHGFNETHERLYSEYFRTFTLELSTENDRLDAPQTIQRLDELIGRLQERSKTYEYSDEKVLAYLQEMEAINDRLEELRYKTPYVVREKIRNMFHLIK